MLAIDEISYNLTQIADHGHQSVLEAQKLAQASEQPMESGHQLSAGTGTFMVS
ncbi:hypothetical protein [Vibrio thalassae]|uniref:hypothetical protein n=1 Tax=Vibrio thalassae TaxID=1243014 RepID=UPI001305131E|nr:hypothetical protein [Vibrio thalassae]